MIIVHNLPSDISVLITIWSTVDYVLSGLLYAPILQSCEVRDAA